MGQHDYNLANASGASFRSDLNSALTAILSNNSSTVAPGTTTQTMFWADTSALVMNLRNAGDAAWIKVFEFTASTAVPYVQSSAGIAVLGSSIVQRTENNVFSKAQRGQIASVSYASSVVLSFNNRRRHTKTRASAQHSVSERQNYQLTVFCEALYHRTTTAHWTST